MENLPYLEGSQVALLRAKASTGHIIDENYEIVNGDFKNAFTIFNDVNIALPAAREIVSENKDVECTIFDKEGAILHHITTDNF
ncbi:hypothetical protein [Chitinophaga nivalis]|uniref:Uncharacterized protein n=1 Tax=Chitinophaga nivalis TaxID=2991709 RepID=A0ABT3IIU4_9BACT|nr:hypothetical protein [Chitinophaga nivalis]MCW3466435.1 hypothetical protein [Chitinophaga nivalis]MCW3483874.1 hypothetical protein [Chitinophaga nivalis]